MKFVELQPDKQMYTMVLSNKTEYTINGATKKRIMDSRSQFVELERGDIINKSFITEIRANLDKTRQELRQLDAEALKILAEKP